MYRPLVFLACVAAVSAHDVIVGSNSTTGKKIFDEKKVASPAIWRQTDKVTIKATDNEVISRVVITDLRPDKNGDATIIEGGEGQKNVTVEIKSPTVFRGYDFHIEVYTVPAENGNQDTLNTTASIANDTEVNENTKETRKTDNNSTTLYDLESKHDELNKGVDVTPVLNETHINASDKKIESSDDDKIDVPAMIGNNQTRPHRDTENQNDSKTPMNNKGHYIPNVPYPTFVTNGRKLPTATEETQKNDSHGNHSMLSQVPEITPIVPAITDIKVDNTTGITTTNFSEDKEHITHKTPVQQFINPSNPTVAPLSTGSQYEIDAASKSTNDGNNTTKPLQDNSNIKPIKN